MANTALNPVSDNRPRRVLWIDYLRSFITLLVVAHHSSLAYTSFARINNQAYILSSAPIVDKQRWVGLDVFENFNDIYFMALMFLIGGIFVVGGLQKKGRSVFLSEKLKRLFIPFLIVVSTFMPVAYFPAFLFTHPDQGFGDFLKDFFFVERWPPGPPWFIWVLFFFNVLFAYSVVLFATGIRRAGDCLIDLRDKPLQIAILFLGLIWIMYVPASWIFGAYTWTGFGPFVFQKSRLLLYFSFFIVGAVIGAPNVLISLFSSESKLVEKWHYWSIGALLVYSILTSLGWIFPHGTGIHGLGAWGDRLAYSSVYALCICFSSMALLTIFARFAVRSKPFWNSLGNNAYCIYLVHYIFVIWGQYLLLQTNFPVLTKFMFCFIFSLGSSWMLSFVLRKIPVIRKYV